MKTNTLLKLTCVAGILATITSPQSARAQSADSLIDKLVEKGILTVKEAKDLREEADKGFNQAFQIKTGMPDWVTAFRLGGDLRLRYDGISFDPDAGASGVDRHRLRYRLRYGFAATLLDNFEVGLRLGSAENKSTGNNGMGDPISGNDTFAFNGSKKPLWIDQAYVKWAALDNSDWSANFIGGKMENPFTFSEIVFDPDYTPEGFAAQIGYHLNPKHDLKFNTGLFSIAEVGGSSRDAYLAGAQLRWDAAWNSKWSTSLGVAGLSLANRQSLTHAAAGANPAVPDVSRGNTRPSAVGAPTSNFNPVVVDGSVTYKLDSFPLYAGAFPIRVIGDYVNNPAAPNLGLDRNEAYSIGLSLGKSGKKGTWDLTYKYKVLEANYWFEELVDSDHGAWYQNAAGPNSYTAGYGAGTNLRGHYMRGAYSPFDSLTLSVTYYLFDLIDKPAGALSSTTGRIQVDAAWKF